MKKQKPFLTPEMMKDVNDALTKRYEAYLQPGERLHCVSGIDESDAWTIKVVFENADKSVHLPLEVAGRRMDLAGIKAPDARGILIDFVGFFFDRYFRGGRTTTLPLDWQEMPFGEYTLFVRGWQRNLQLEEAADRLLAGEAIDEFLSPRERAQRSNGS